MMRDNLVQRLLALDLRTRRFGYVVFEGEEVVDWDIKRFAGKSGVEPELLRKHVLDLVNLSSPSAVVVCMGRRRSGGSGLSSVIARIVKRESNGRAIRVRILSVRRVKRAFARQGYANKDEIARYIAGRIPGLAWILPRKRKFYESEQRYMTIFDAAAAGLAHLDEKV
jgi:hypothetical protein